ncbi:mannitol dehydrogenase family protein [Kribbella sp. NPDC026611]|uniref:mannitol dehydrogenase family protein n=1 Tax=Kribbella sp. NPDC026611 TaxID=3154911 RepID=UPI0034077DBE
MSRLSLDNLPVAPSVDPRALSVGIVHLGLGAFHRAHQAVITERAAVASGETRWGIAGVSQRSANVRDQLAPQDGLYSVLERGLGDPSAMVIGSIREVLTAPEDPDAVVDRIADPAVKVVTLTVTEKGYRAANGGLDLDDPEIQADLTGRPPRTVVGQLAAGLTRRTDPLTIVSCDNLVANGPFLRKLVTEYFDALGKTPDTFAATKFPASMVDRIVPATTDADRDEAARLLGVRDEAVVVAEPFLQWVIEDDFAGDHPAWEQAGAVLTADVAPWEQAKLRMLNATHSMLAYLGALKGYETIAEAVRDDELHHLAQRLMTEDVVPTLTPPDGLDLAEYGATVIERFANPALKHKTRQVAMDGSVKLPVRMLGTVADRLAAGAEPQVISLAVAAWMVYVQETPDLDDPQEAKLKAALDGASEPGEVVDALLGVDSVFTPDLRDSTVFRELLVGHVTALAARS